ncbi:MAG: hypothetical protein LBB76_12835, partial [Azoarcus sp.]|nr:hypothetical protein [Azoarcus sp.]
NPTWVHHRRKAPLLFDLLVLRIVGTNVGLRYAYPTYKTDHPPPCHCGKTFPPLWIAPFAGNANSFCFPNLYKMPVS